MRRAMQGPVVLFEWFEPIGEARAGALSGALLEGRHQGAAQEVHALRAAQGRGFGAVSLWSQGQEAAQGREASVMTAAWRAAAPKLARQPQVHMLALYGLPWPALPAGPWSLAVVTVDTGAIVPWTEARPPRALLPREALPAVEGALLWPVIGHPGRLAVRADDPAQLDAALASLEVGWGPQAEPAERWVLVGG